MSASRLSLSRPEHGSTWMANEPEGNAENLKTDSLKELHDLALKALFSLIHIRCTLFITQQNIVMLASPVIREEVFFQDVIMQLFMD